MEAKKEIKIRSISKADENRRHLDAFKDIARGMEDIEKYIVMQAAPTHMLIDVIRERIVKLSEREREVMSIYGSESRRNVEKEMERLKCIEDTLCELESRCKRSKSVFKNGKGE